MGAAGVKLHPRHEIVTRAELDFTDAYLKVMQQCNLTPLEWTRIFLNAAQKWSTYALREERHGQGSDKKADEA